MKQSPSESGSLVGKALANPLLETVENLGNVPQGTAPSAHDSSIDADPYFARSQRWLSTSGDAATDEDAGDITFAVDSASMSLRLRGTGRTWQLTAPLHPVYSTGELVLLAANDASYFDRTGGGEGLFFVSVGELRAAAAQPAGERVPVYFFPMPDPGWTGAIHALEFPELQTLVVVDNHGEGIPLDEEDIEQVIDVGKMTFSMAVAAGARSATLNRAPLGQPILPPRGSTAGFGLLFTGFDWDHPELGVFQPLHVSWWQKASRDVTGWLIPEAKADGLTDGLLLHNLLWAGTVTGVMFVASVVLKYTVFREFFAQRAASEAPVSGWRAVRREGRDIGDTFAHTLSAARQFPKVWFGKGVRYFVDSWFPRLNSSHNNLIRRFLDWSVYYSAETAQRVPVNLRTLALQFFVLGGVNSASYAIQLYWFVPWAAEHIASIDPAMQERVKDAFAENNPELQSFRRNEVVQNLVNHLTDPSIASNLKDYYSSTLRPGIEDELRSRGIYPTDPHFEAARDALLEHKVQQSLAKYGLPGSKDFLFDSATLWNFVVEKILGYRPGELKAEMAGRHFSAQEHPGLLGPAVKAALKQARARLAQHPSDAGLISAVALLEKAHHDISYLHSFARYPAQVLWEGIHGRGPPALSKIVEAVRETRQVLVALTFNGPVEPTLKDAPNAWVRSVGEPGARLAGEFFRRSFFAFANGRNELLRAPTNEERAEIGDRAEKVKRQSIDELADNHSAEFNKLMEENGGKYEEADAALAKMYPGELAYLQDKAVTKIIADKAEADEPFTQPHHGWYRRKQEARAKESTALTFRKRFGHDFSPLAANEGERKAWNDIYATAMMAEVSVYPDYEAAPGLKDRVEARATANMKLQLDNEKAKTFLDSMTAEQRVDFAATMYAENVTRAYVDLATNSELPGSSTAQPGRFQHLRQTQYVRERPFLTRVIRSVEAFFPLEAHQAGFSAKVYRNLPMAYDFVISNVRTYRNLLTAIVAVYPFSWLVWGIALPPHLFLLATVTIFLSMTPVAVLNRFCQMQGFQPLGSIRNMFLYSLGRSWVDFVDLFPDLMLEKDFHALTETIEMKIHNGLESSAAAVGLSSSSCKLSLGRLGKAD